jgi:tetratricopeptide (TPR) repeat protein
MGRLIICNSSKAKEPYYFENAGIYVYTIEEIAYVIVNYGIRILNELFDLRLADFIEKGLDMKPLADRLKNLINSNSGVKAVVKEILEASDYVSEAQEKEILDKIDSYYRMNLIAREKLEADTAAKNKEYTKALIIYRKIMTDSEQDTLTKSQKAGVYHNAAVAIANMGMFKKAGEYFLKAYETGGTQPSLVQYLLALKLCENEEPSGMFENEVKRLHPSDDCLHTVSDLLYRARMEYENSGLSECIKNLGELYMDGRLPEYEKESSKITDRLKKDYKKKFS